MPLFPSTIRPQSNLQNLFNYSRTLFRTPRVPSESEIKQCFHLMSKISLEELGLQNYPRKSRGKVIEYLSVYEGKDFDIGIFCLPKDTTIPLHDHPQMTVLTRLLYGRLHSLSYDLIQPTSQPSIYHARYNGQNILQEDNNLSEVKPTTGNIHQFHALSDCAVLDLLAPPYSTPQGRSCTYYQCLEDKQQKKEERVLQIIPEPAELMIFRGNYRGIRPFL